MNCLRSVNYQVNIVPPCDNDDSLADDTDNDPDYTPDNEGWKRFRYDPNLHVGHNLRSKVNFKFIRG